MIDYLHAFGIGIAFSVGVVTGATLCTLATRQGRKEAADEMRKHFAQVEERLTGSLACHQRMAHVMEALAARNQATATSDEG